MQYASNIEGLITVWFHIAVYHVTVLNHMNSLGKINNAA